jgi:hypothetical protein
MNLITKQPDDFINPPELGIAEREVKRVNNTRFVLIAARGLSCSVGAGIAVMLCGHDRDIASVMLAKPWGARSRAGASNVSSTQKIDA